MKGVILSLFLFLSFCLPAQKKLTVYTNKIVAPVSPTMWGIFLKTSILAQTVVYMQRW